MFPTSGSSRSSIVVGRPDSTVLEPGNGHSAMTLTQSDELSTFRPPEQTEFLLNQVLERNQVLEKTRQELEAASSTSQSLASQVKKLQKELDDAHSFIFNLQPATHVITPTQALEDYKTLCMKVEDWVQDNLGDGLEKGMHVDDITIESVEQFVSLVSPQGRSAFGIPKTAENILIESIMNFLYRRIFRLDFWCMEPDAMLFLEHIERSMHKLEPRRSFATIRTWRSETLLALANRPEYTALKQQTLRNLTLDLSASLSVFLPNCDVDEVCKSLQESLIEPAASLAHRFQLSVDRFEVEFTGLNPVSCRHADMTLYEYQNLSGKILKSPAATNNVYIMDVCPGLFYTKVKADGFGDQEVLKKPKILVAATKPGEREWQPPTTRPGHPSTLLAWLDETCAAKKRSKPWYT
ncbi:uncharacterized protein LY89DRAFT_217207 [Mollisia scopiformis]|uniref:Uncharacterized protein n=1 Tax=Mollisia scopiformis TaxID=149040 RepID=A0A194WWK3_MOLSC|nr:uncharacterized protein LY89DRAFT_217207 [Mollisia scopiformis]KUJ11962.1 hypothetical protein LY89DRAFT_217207 [Mollisia scopiformis]